MISSTMIGRLTIGVTGAVLAAALGYSQTETQPLGDIARSAKVARKSAPAAKVITNEDLGPGTSAHPGLLAYTDDLRIFYTDLGEAIELDIRVSEDTTPLIRADYE